MTLASVLVAGASPSFAQGPPAMPPTAPVQQQAAPAPQQEAAANGVQNWRYSEFVNAVQKDKVEKVEPATPRIFV